MSFYDTAFDRCVQPAIDKLVPQGADGWQLYSTEPGSNEAASELTSKLRSLLGDIGKRFVSGMKEMDVTMTRHASLGASDTEPRAELMQAVERFLRYLHEELV